MVASTLQQPTRGWFDVLDDCILNATALSLWAGLDYFFFPLLILQLVGNFTGTTFVTKLVYPRVGV